MERCDYPEIIRQRLDDLEALCEKYPKKIPLVEAAEFMGIGIGSMRGGIARGEFPFAVRWCNERFVGRGKNMTATDGRAVIVIPTLPFYFYMIGQFAPSLHANFGGDE